MPVTGRDLKTAQAAALRILAPRTLRFFGFSRDASGGYHCS